ncbi:hypothetical protein FGRMN_2333 [Fusarium graminum]|nr:hypothetical protein FGRMN_2333 [Fusarium graminum]
METGSQRLWGEKDDRIPPLKIDNRLGGNTDQPKPVPAYRPELPQITIPVASSIATHDNESISSVDSFDPAPTIVQARVTRQDALDQAEDLAHKISNLEYDQEALKPRMTKWMSEPTLRVLPPDLKASVRLWCWHHDPKWFHTISKFIDEDISEWNYTFEVPNRRRDMGLCGLGADILRFYVTDLKPLRKGLPEQERREVVNKVRNGIALFAEYHDEKLRAVRNEANNILDKERELISAERSAFIAAFELQNQAMLD